MSPPSTVPNGRNRLLHRFYEPLVLLHVIEPCQGDRLSRPPLENVDLDSESSWNKELRRWYLDAIAYACDFDKGGDSITAIIITLPVLTYRVACNKAPGPKVIDFLRDLIGHLKLVDGKQRRGKSKLHSTIFEKCVTFSKDRLATYNRYLHFELNDCKRENNSKEIADKLDGLEIKLLEVGDDHQALCLLCKQLMKSPEFEFVEKRVRAGDNNRTQRCHFTALRHFIGRLAYHVKIVDILMEAARRLPGLFADPEVSAVPHPSKIQLAPGVRQKGDLNGIAKRMTSSSDSAQLLRLQNLLADLDQRYQIEDKVRKEYDEKRSSPCVHAELLLLEYMYQHREDYQAYDDDLYIGCSKPACYCCYLYIRAHRGGFVPPATHQKIYTNWMPPTCAIDPKDMDPASIKHEKYMLNSMVKAIRERAIEQIEQRSGGRRPKQFDTTTGDNFSEKFAITIRAYQRDHMSDTGTVGGDSSDERDGRGSGDDAIGEIASRFKHAVRVTEQEQDSDTEGGVALG